VVDGIWWCCAYLQYNFEVSSPSGLASTLCHFSKSNSLFSAQNVVKVRHERGERSRVALLGLIPFFVTWTLIPAYLYLQPNILHNHLAPFVFYAGLINAYSVGQIITAHLVKLDFPYYNVLVLPLAFGVIDSLGPWLQQHIGIGWPSALGDGVYQVAYMFCMLGIAIGVYGSFVVCLPLSQIWA
jgi:ethanolaminephosphotransferase